MTSQLTNNTDKLRVKLIARNLVDADDPTWHNQLDMSRFGPNGSSSIEFTLNPDDRNYDWLVIYDEIPKLPLDANLPNGPTRQTEKLNCSPENTILVTSEPSTIKIYGKQYLSQFGHVLTGLEPWSVRDHEGAIFEQSSMVWYYGRKYEDPSMGRSGFEDIADAPWPDKPKLISTICSSKQQRHTLHNQRYEFTQLLKSRLPDLELFGHGSNWVSDKADALDPYKYHVAIENHISQNHWTEKLADTFLGYCLPLYFGATKAEDYFPNGAIIKLDLARPDWSIDRIIDAIKNDEFTGRKPAIEEARSLILHEYNLFPNIARLISHRNIRIEKPTVPTMIKSRHAMRKSDPKFAIYHLVEKFLLTRRSTKNQKRLVPIKNITLPR